MRRTSYPHIVRDADGLLRVRNPWFKVIMLVGDHVYRGMGAAELVEAHPPLTLSEAHSVLAYYYDHQPELDAELDRRRRHADEARADLEDTGLRERLREGYARWRTTRA
jgi:hypothetical protein